MSWRRSLALHCFWEGQRHISEEIHQWRQRYDFVWEYKLLCFLKKVLLLKNLIWVGVEYDTELHIAAVCVYYLYNYYMFSSKVQPVWTLWDCKCKAQWNPGHVFQVMELLPPETLSQENSCWSMLEDISLALKERTWLKSIQLKMQHFCISITSKDKTSGEYNCMNTWTLNLSPGINIIDLFFSALMAVKIQQDLEDS